MWHDLLLALKETLFMVFSSALLVILVAFPISFLLTLSYQSRHSRLNLICYRSTAFLFNTMRSIPYMVFMVALIPLTQWCLSIVPFPLFAAIIPLTIATIPSFAVTIHKALAKVPVGLTETAEAMGASSTQTIWYVAVPEARPEIIRATSQLVLTLISYSTIAGALGAGGLGQLVIQNGFYVFNIEYVFYAIVMLIALIRLTQFFGSRFAEQAISR